MAPIGDVIAHVRESSAVQIDVLRVAGAEERNVGGGRLLLTNPVRAAEALVVDDEKIRTDRLELVEERGGVAFAAVRAEIDDAGVASRLRADPRKALIGVDRKRRLDNVDDIERLLRGDECPRHVGTDVRRHEEWARVAARAQNVIENRAGAPFEDDHAPNASRSRAIEELTRVDSSVAITVAAHTSLGTMPILLYGTEEQKQDWLPDLAAGRKLAACLSGGHFGFIAEELEFGKTGGFHESRHCRGKDHAVYADGGAADSTMLGV